MVDIPAGITTTAVVAVGGSFSDTLELALDRDWIRVSLTAGQTYLIALDGSGGTALADPFVRLYDAGGSFLVGNDDDGPGFNSLLTYTVLTTGVYYIEAAAFSTGTGGYTLSVDQRGPLQSLESGTAMPDNNVTVYFAPAGVVLDGVTGEGFNAYELTRFQAAFDLIESLTNLTFTTQNTAVGADFRLVLDLNEIPFLGYFYYPTPGDPNAGIGVFGGDTWDRAAGGDLEAGGYSFVTIVHELLHGLGLSHPHDDGVIMDGVTSAFGDYGDFNLNQGIFTTMSYNTGFFTGSAGSQPPANELYGHEFGPMALDIAILQDKYGANASTNTGNTIYTLDTVNAVGTYFQAIWDASGSADEIRQTGNVAAVIDLRAATLIYAAGGGGFVSAVNGIAGGFTIAAGVVIERATGGSGSDVLTGNAAANLLTGNAGNDTLDGGAGNDTLTGGSGNDTFIVDALSDIITETGGQGIADRVLARASFVLAADDSIEVMQTTSFGGVGAINLTGNALAQQITGNAGANVLTDGAGAADTLRGSLGNDTYVIRTAGSLIIEAGGQGSADQVRAAVSFGLAGDDNIEVMQTTSFAGTGAINLTGNALGQTIIGNAGANTLEDGAG